MNSSSSELSYGKSSSNTLGMLIILVDLLFSSYIKLLGLYDLSYHKIALFFVGTYYFTPQDTIPWQMETQ